jgi:hypothetical protein
MENQVNNNQLTESIDKKDETNHTNENPSINVPNQVGLGIKRDRDNETQINNIDFKKQKVENVLQQTNEPLPPPIQHIHPGNMMNNPYQPISANSAYPSIHNSNLLNNIPQPGMYGYNKSPMYYYNQPSVPAGMQSTFILKLAYSYNAGRPYAINTFNPTTIYPGGYHYIPSAIPQAYSHAIPGTNPYNTNYSQMILSQTQQ